MTRIFQEDFDKTYAKQQISAHKDAEKLFSKYADKGDNEAVKAFATKTLPVIKQRLEEARSSLRTPTPTRRLN